MLFLGVRGAGHLFRTDDLVVFRSCHVSGTDTGFLERQILETSDLAVNAPAFTAEASCEEANNLCRPFS